MCTRKMSATFKRTNATTDIISNVIFQILQKTVKVKVANKVKPVITSLIHLRMHHKIILILPTFVASLLRVCTEFISQPWLSFDLFLCRGKIQI